MAVRGTNVSLLSPSSATRVAECTTAAAHREARQVESCYRDARRLAGLDDLPLRPFEVELAAQLEARGTFARFGPGELAERFARTMRELRARGLAVSLRSVANRDGEVWRPIGAGTAEEVREVSTVPRFDAEAYRRSLLEGA